MLGILLSIALALGGAATAIDPPDHQGGGGAATAIDPPDNSGGGGSNAIDPPDNSGGGK
jgi:hypothetical protein